MRVLRHSEAPEQAKVSSVGWRSLLIFVDARQANGRHGGQIKRPHVARDAFGQGRQTQTAIPLART